MSLATAPPIPAYVVAEAIPPEFRSLKAKKDYVIHAGMEKWVGVVGLCRIGVRGKGRSGPAFAHFTGKDIVYQPDHVGYAYLIVAVPVGPGADG